MALNLAALVTSLVLMLWGLAPDVWTARAPAFLYPPLVKYFFHDRISSSFS
jgi:hypothetical protein